ncbi:hypothetical protein [Streptomyces rimosus]|uniref:hypothetical protein n=1 Tax=Streptomyces rimosus TaxID=1927 RepID=UPI000AE0257D|nr:hypothetical protein [Streptomyces rimosus]
MVVVDCKADGNFKMTAGGSATEVNALRVGRNEFERSFGGIELTVQNLPLEDITVTTE